MSLWRKIRFSHRPWRMPWIIEAWFSWSETITRPGNRSGRVDSVASLAM